MKGGTMIEEDDLPDDDPAVEYWIPFLRRMKKIPREYQMAIIDEYLKVENTGKDMNVEKMWDLLLAGEEETRLIMKKGHKGN